MPIIGLWAPLLVGSEVPRSRDHEKHNWQQHQSDFHPFRCLQGFLLAVLLRSCVKRSSVFGFCSLVRGSIEGIFHALPFVSQVVHKTWLAGTGPLFGEGRSWQLNSEFCSA